MKKLKKILLIDDDEINNFINVHILQKLNIAEKIKVAKNGKEALDFIKDTCGPNDLICPEFIILDYKMPVMDGIEFLENLHKLKFQNWHEVIFLALAAHLKEDTIEELRRLGVQEFTSKPLSEELIMELYGKYWAQKAETKRNN